MLDAKPDGTIRVERMKLNPDELHLEDLLRPARPSAPAPAPVLPDPVRQPRYGRGMAEHEVVDQGGLREVAQWLDDWEWPVAEADVISRAADFGWTVLDDDPGKGHVFETGLLKARSWASSDLKNGEVYELTIFTSPLVEPSSEGRRYLEETLATQVRTVTEVVGEPGPVEADERATWQLVSGALLMVGRTDRSCSWTLVSPWSAQLQRDVSRYENEGEQQD